MLSTYNRPIHKGKPEGGGGLVEEVNSKYLSYVSKKVFSLLDLMAAHAPIRLKITYAAHLLLLVQN